MFANKQAVLAVALAIAASATYGQSSRDYINIVGSSTVYPFATVVAERFGKTSGFKTPKIESTGSGGGLKLFCGGVGVGHPDITNASRRIKSTEVEQCATNGVTEIIEVKIGYDGIVMANAKAAPAYSLRQFEIFLALAKHVPDPAGSGDLVANPYQTWREINPELPATTIEVLGPPPTSGTRDAFVELVMDAGCEKFNAISALKDDKDAFRGVCRTMREDGAFIEAGENDNLIVRKLQANPDAIGIFGFSFLDQNLDKLHGAEIDGVAPTFDNIADGAYPVSRPLYLYVKKAHVGVIPGIAEFLREFVSDRAAGEDGYLSDKGLIPTPAAEFEQYRGVVETLRTLNLKS